MYTLQNDKNEWHSKLQLLWHEVYSANQGALISDTSPEASALMVALLVICIAKTWLESSHRQASEPFFRQVMVIMHAHLAKL